MHGHGTLADRADEDAKSLARLRAIDEAVLALLAKRLARILLEDAEASASGDAGCAGLVPAASSV